MARRQSPALTDAELRIMRVLWNLQRATVAEILVRMESAGTDIPAHNTVLTILGILERKGDVRQAHAPTRAVSNP